MRHSQGGGGPERRLVVRGYGVTHPSGTVVLPTEPGWDQLIYASAGVMTVEASDARWVVPPHRALWAPHDRQHRLVMHGRVAVRTLYFRAELAILPERWWVVNVPPLLRELILHAVRISPLDVTRGEQRRLVGVIIDQLTTLPQAPLQLPLPRDPRAARLVRALVADLSGVVPLDEHVAEAGASRRTLERVFLAETGMTIGRCRQQRRLIRSLELLAAGQPVTTVAHAVGYATPSAFTAMFRQQLGEPPSRYFQAT